MTQFLPDNYEVPQSEGKYFKLKIGQNRFRILTSAIVGWVGWDKSGDKPKPIRIKVDQTFNIGDVDDPNETKHFWAFMIWNYEAKKIQIFEITQKTIMKAIKSLTKDEDWGDPMTYDISIEAVGEKLEREYITTPKPQKELLEEIKAEWDKIKDKVNLEKLYDNEDPFGDDEKDTSTEANVNGEDINVEDIPL